MDKEIRELVSAELDNVFKKVFKLTDKDIKSYIERILDEKDEDVILSLTDFFLKFEQYTDNSIYSVERAKAGKLVLDRSIKMYLSNKEKFKEGFFKAMDFAILQNIDPIKIATMENLRGLNAQIYKNTYDILTQIEYDSPISGEKSRLFDDKDFKELIENCASIICHVNEENVKDIVSALNHFVYDKEEKAFLTKTTPAEMIKNCGTLLTYPSARLQSNIDFLIKNFVPPMAKADLVDRISKSPSILLCDQTKINNFEKCIYQNLVELKNENSALFPEGEKFEEFAISYARKATFNIDKLSSISGLTKENLDKFSETKNVLVKYLGAKNAFETFTDFNVLSIEPQILDGLLAKLTEYDNQNNTLLRKFFIEHTARALNMLQQDEQISITPSKRTGRTVTPRRVIADIGSLPKDVSGETFLTSSNKKIVESLFDNVKTTFEARKAKRVVDGVVQLSEEEEEEREYMKEVFDRIQNEFDVSKCTSPFDELISRMEAMIDAKEGKGFAEKRFEINRMRHLYSLYAKSGEDAKILAENLFPVLLEMNSLERQGRDFCMKDFTFFVDVTQKHGEILRKFNPLAYKVDEIFTTVKRYVFADIQKVFERIGMRPFQNDDEEDRKDGDYNPRWFSKEEQNTVLLTGLSITQTLTAYARYIRNYMYEIVPDAKSNVNFRMSLSNFRHQQIDIRYLLYASRMRWETLSKSNNLYKEEVIPLERVGILGSSKVAIPSINVLAKPSKNIEALFGGQPYSLLGNMDRNIINQIRASEDIEISVVDAFERLNKASRLFKKPMEKNSDNMEEIWHTAGGLMFYCPSNENKLAVFVVEPLVKTYENEIEGLGVKMAQDEHFKDATVANYTYLTSNITNKDIEAMAPVTFEASKA